MVERQEFPERSVGVLAKIEPEAGQWVVFLDVSFWNQNGAETPQSTVRSRIEVYPTLERAQMAANFIVLAATKDLKYPPPGS